jgi:nitrite reductase (NADH) large subunit
MANTGSFDVWRMAHIVLGILALLTLLAHTGLRSGHGLNLWLMLSFTGLILLGSVYSATLGLQHRLSTTTSTRLRKKSLNWHIYLFWPVPVLLGFHILKSYWF